MITRADAAGRARVMVDRGDRPTWVGNAFFLSPRSNRVKVVLSSGSVIWARNEDCELVES